MSNTAPAGRVPSAATANGGTARTATTRGVRERVQARGLSYGLGCGWSRQARLVSTSSTRLILNPLEAGGLHVEVRALQVFGEVDLDRVQVGDVDRFEPKAF